MGLPLEMVHLPHGDDRIPHEGDHGGTGAQAVEAVAEVHRIGPGGHEEVHPDHEQNDRHNPTSELEAQEWLLYEAHACLCHWESRPGGNNERKHREYGGEDDLTEELASHRQALVLLLAYLGEIVDEAEDTHRNHGEQCENGRPSGPCPRRAETVQGRGSPAEHHGQHDDHAAERWRAAFDLMRLGAVLADVLTVIELVHNADQQRGTDERDDQRRQNSYDEGDHEVTPFVGVVAL